MPVNEFIRPIASSRTLVSVMWMALLAGAYSGLPIALEYSPFASLNEMPSQFHAALSLILGLLLVFRTNTAYSRWWEARTLWGALVNASRNLALKLTRLGSIPSAELEQARELIVFFPVALRCHLRSETSDCQTSSMRELVGATQHVPLAVAGRLYEMVGHARHNAHIDGDELRVLDAELLRLMDICGGCERILKTRIVKSYRVFARQCVVIFLATLPWGFAHDFGLWTLPLTIISAYFMLGLETVAEHVEEPFGYDEDDLDLETLCEGIERTVNQVFANPA